MRTFGTHPIFHHPTGEAELLLGHVRHLGEVPGVHIHKVAGVEFVIDSRKEEVAGVQRGPGRVAKVLWEI